MAYPMRLWRLRRRARRDPGDGPARLELARALADAGEADEALAEARAARAHLGDPADRLALGDLLAALDAPEEAARAWHQVWLDAPDTPGAAARWGRHLLASGRAAEAVDPLRRALTEAPDDTLRRGLVRALQAAGATGEAARLLGELVERHPDDPDLAVEHGRALLGTGQAARGLEALRRAHRLRPDGRTTMALGVALGQSGFGAEAVVLFERHLAEHPGSLSAQINCGIAYGEIGDHATAIRYLLDATHRAPHLAVVQQNLGVVFARMGQLEAAIDALRMATRLAPADAALQLQLARLLARQGDLHEGLAAATLAANLAGDAVQIELAARELRDTLKITVTGEYPALGSSSDGLDRPSAMSGVLAEFPLPNLLEFLRSERRSGLLQIVSLAGVGEIRLSRGDIGSVSVSQVPRLGELLIERGELDRPRLDAALADRPAGGPLGQQLVAAGLPLDTLRAALRDQALRGLMELLTWERGQFSFIAEDRPPAPESWPTQGLLLDALRQLDEAGFDDAAGSIELVGELFGEFDEPLGD